MTRIVLSVALLVSLAIPSAAASPARTTPLYYVGVNYSHFSNNGNCTADGATSLNDTGILANYQQPGVPARVARQMAIMRQRGVQVLRLILWHQTHAGGRTWGVVSSSGGQLADGVRAAFVGYLKAARKARFAQLTVSFGPMSTNNPASPAFTPAEFEENWMLIQRVRALARRYGPRSIHIDLENEAPPNDSDPRIVSRIGSYLAEIYGRYVERYGNQDVSVSVIANQTPADTRARLGNLIEALRTTDLPLPLWFDVHPSYTRAGRDLEVVDRLLRARGLAQPLVLSEVAYNDPGSAEAIDEFNRTADRDVLEVTEWPLARDRPCRGMSASPPYRVDAYAGRRLA